MKHSIKLLAMGLLLSTGLFAAVPVKPTSPKSLPIKNMVTFASLPSRRGVEIKLNDQAYGKAIVMIYDWDNDIVWKDALSPKKGFDRAFILSQLDNGNYTVEVTVDRQLVAKKTAHVYYRGDSKFVTIRG